jgi:hypothetical protein
VKETSKLHFREKKPTVENVLSNLNDGLVKLAYRLVLQIEPQSTNRESDQEEIFLWLGRITKSRVEDEREKELMRKMRSRTKERTSKDAREGIDQRQSKVKIGIESFPITFFRIGRQRSINLKKNSSCYKMKVKWWTCYPI